jgi:UDP-N-acetylmuramoyl-L-alanyl-D-glutamate--2,6-diaminopimelate ligase
MREYCRAPTRRLVRADRRIALATLLDRLDASGVFGPRTGTIESIDADSRRVRSGSLFVAVRGITTDGHRYVRQAVENGARAVVVEGDAPSDLGEGVTLARVLDSRRALSALAAAFYGDPSHDLDVIGITGTNGKTTTAHMVAALCDAAGLPCGRIGTIGAQFDSLRWRLENTTPLPQVLHEIVAEMRDTGAKAVAMEVSSHALALGRVDDVRFRIAVLTNVARDHLDFHETLEAYAAAKRRLFSLASACVINADDAHGARWAQELRREAREVVLYGTSPQASLVPRSIVATADRTQFIVDGQRFELHLPGRFNVWNALAAIGVARLLGIDDAVSARGLASVERVAGRMERFVADGVAVVVDYAHTPDALENALNALRETTGGALAVVFGCGGDRDRGKRSQMGAIAAALADRLYVTSDNPRTEAPQAIADAIVSGIGDRPYAVELDRRRAIERAIAQAQPGDVVLVAGKGHESYQIVGDRVLPFDDAEVAREALAARRVLR